MNGNNGPQRVKMISGVRHADTMRECAEILRRGGLSVRMSVNPAVDLIGSNTLVLAEKHPEWRDHGGES